MKKIKAKIDYQRWTFFLSVIGFIGSIGFYVGVLNQVYDPDQDVEKMRVLEVENEKLHKTIFVLTEELKQQKASVQ
ncbi:MAG: hypothetical protein HYZ14_15295 [Bacteroidetes bacterium]|nr:hypothetical protein [Bacteroidota bacterium]